jgi:serine/threonine protein kinase
VAVKKVLETTTQNLGEFINEVALITDVPEHKNLVKFLGCCYTISNERFLVYEYVENNDLHETLFSEFSLYQTSHAISTTKFLDDMNA